VPTRGKLNEASLKFKINHCHMIVAFINPLAENWNDVVLTLDEQDKELERGMPISEPGIYAKFHTSRTLTSHVR
jgi:RNA polymerase subunit RPABC4/transcription elongation factor Spt4